jgi:hypothetical protein
MVRLGQKQTDIEVELLFPVRLLKERHDLSPGLFNLSPVSNYSDFFVLLLDIVERMVDLFERRVP